MTTRPSPSHLEALRLERTKYLAHLIEIRRRDGVTIYCTDHDRILTFERHEYRPVVMGSMSADRREAALRSGNQEASGIVDGVIVTAAALERDAFVGAEVRIIDVCWRTLRVFARHRKWIREVKRSGVTWTVTMEGRTQSLQRPSGGRFGGFHVPKCFYTLGHLRTCKKDIGQWTQVDHLVSGTSTSATSVSLTDTTETWIPDFFVGYRIVTYGGGVGSGQERIILSNTSDTVEIDEPWDVIPSGVTYRIGLGPNVVTVVRDRYEFEIDAANWIGTEVDGWYQDGTLEFTTGANAGSAHSIVQWVAATKTATLLIPTRLPVEVGDQAIVRVGCNGLASTCKDKFDNLLNFGGNPFIPSAQQLVEPPEDT